MKRKQSLALHARPARMLLQQQGYYVGGKLAVGYTVKNGKIVMNDNWPLVLKAMHQWKKKKLSYRTIVQMVMRQFGMSISSATCFRILNQKRKL